MKFKDTDVILRARNGAVIAYDETGLIIRLSDQVLEDIATRVASEDSADLRQLDIDAWNIRGDGEWIRFDAKLPPFDYTRAYLQPKYGGHTIADTQGPLCAVLTVGGVAASRGFD